MTAFEVPAEWKKLDLSRWAGTIVVIGQTDSGKSTFARWLVGRLCQHHDHVGWLDADVGQSTLGVPTTMNLAVVGEPPVQLPPPDATFFVGATSPRGHMLPAVVGAHKLQQRARALGAGAIVVDTTGLVAPEIGGGVLKQWKIALLEPAVVVAMQRHGELVHILAPLVRAPTPGIQVLPVAFGVNRKSMEERAERRRRQFQKYFAGAAPLAIHHSRLAVYDLELADQNRLLALEDRHGFTIALGILIAVNRREMTVLTPARNTTQLARVRLGSLRLRPETGEEVR